MMSKQGKIITVTSSKGGVGKTIFLLNLAGIFSKLNQKILLVDCDFTGGAIALNLDLNTDKNIFHVYDDVVNHRFKNHSAYITKYNDDIDVIGASKDPRQALKIEASYIMSFLKQVKNNYDVILVDTTNGLNKDNVTIIDESDLVLYLLTNDLMDIHYNAAFKNHKFNKKVYLSDTSIPIICFDNTFCSAVGNIKPFKLDVGKNVSSYTDNFCCGSRDRLYSL